MVQEQELGQAILIESISFMVEDYYSSWKDSVSIYMALTDLNELTVTFESNYTVGTRRLVLEADTLDTWVPYMILSGSLGLDQRTFASIKVIAGSH